MFRDEGIRKAFEGDVNATVADRVVIQMIRRQDFMMINCDRIGKPQKRWNSKDMNEKCWYETQDDCFVVAMLYVRFFYLLTDRVRV
jgi:hypothetical protein